MVSATGLKVLPFGGLKFEVDGRPVDLAQTMSYKALMLSGLPNFVYTVGYTNASWTLKADLVTDYACRLLDHLDQNGHRYAVAHKRPLGEREAVHRLQLRLRPARHRPACPSRATGRPWLLKQNYLTDVRMIRRDDIDDGVLTFA